MVPQERTYSFQLGDQRQKNLRKVEFTVSLGMAALTTDDVYEPQAAPFPTRTIGIERHCYKSAAKFWTPSIVCKPLTACKTPMRS